LITTVNAWDRQVVVCNVPTACNRATADFVLSSPLTGEEYQRPSNAYLDPASGRSHPPQTALNAG
jgi:methylglyoxal synthase